MHACEGTGLWGADSRVWESRGDKEETGDLNLWAPWGGRDCASRFLRQDAGDTSRLRWDPKSQGTGPRGVCGWWWCTLLSLREEGG